MEGNIFNKGNNWTIKGNNKNKCTYFLYFQYSTRNYLHFIIWYVQYCPFQALVQVRIKLYTIDFIFHWLFILYEHHKNIKISTLWYDYNNVLAIYIPQSNFRERRSKMKYRTYFNHTYVGIINKTPNFVFQSVQ